MSNQMISSIIERSQNAYLDQEEQLAVNILGPDIADELIEMLKTHHNPSIASRAFHALMILENFDTLNFLIKYYNEGLQIWRWACIRSLASFSHPKAVSKLCDVLVNSSDVELRLAAIDSLRQIKSPNSLYAIEYASQNDFEEDFTGILVSVSAKDAIEIIKSDLGSSIA